MTDVPNADAEPADDDPTECLVLSDDPTEPGADAVDGDLGPDPLGAVDTEPLDADPAEGYPDSVEAGHVEAASAESFTIEDADGADAAVDPDAPVDDVIDAEDLLDEQDAEPFVSPWAKPGKWYVVHTQSGYEKKVQSNLKARTSSMNMEERIHEVVIPMEDVVEFKNGKKVVVQKKVFPGYLLVRCDLDDDSWYVIRNTPGVTGFVGQRGKPKLEYEMGETVRVKEGPFADFSGEIIDINEDHLKVKVLVNIFGRETPVELEFSQVAKL
jgi:transcriptional antiterminator NusG